MSIVRLYARNSGMYWDINLADYPKVWDRTWSATKNGYAISARDGKTIYLHREIMGLPSGSKLQVDHKYGDLHDNRKESLRIVTGSENQQNRAVSSGVISTSGKYYAAITAFGKTYVGSRRPTYEQARADFLAMKAKKHPTALLVPIDSKQ